MLNPIRFVNNIFDDQNFSDKSLRIFTEDHLIRLANNNTSGTYTPLLLATTTRYTIFYGDLSSEDIKKAISQGFTLGTNFARTAFLKGLSDYKNLIAFRVKENTPAYEEFFPHGVSEFYEAPLDGLSIIMDRLMAASNTHLLVSDPTEVAAMLVLVNNYKAARTAQLNAFSLAPIPFNTVT